VSPKRIARAVLRILVLLAVVGALLLLFEKRLIYFPTSALAATPAELGLAHEELSLRAEDGVRLHGWFLPVTPGTRFETVGGATDLRNMHPIGVSYSDCVANGDTELQPIGSGLLPKMLKGTKQTVECASCHDIHETIGNAGKTPYDHALIVPLENGALCMACHNK